MLRPPSALGNHSTTGLGPPFVAPASRRLLWLSHPLSEPSAIRRLVL